MNTRDTGYIIDILLAGRAIQQFSAGRDSDDLINDEMYQAAVLRKLEIIGEVAKRLSIEFKEKHSTINWKGWAGLRDKLIHGYDDVNLDLIYAVIISDLPLLLSSLSPYETENR